MGTDEACEARRTAVMYAAGEEIDWNARYSAAGHMKARLPVYPFQRKRCWLDLTERELYRPFFYRGGALFPAVAACGSGSGTPAGKSGSAAVREASVHASVYR